MLTLDQLRAADARTFYKLDRRSKNYFSAWKAVHMLNTLHHPQFRAYMTGLARGQSDGDAWADAFAPIPPRSWPRTTATTRTAPSSVTTRRATNTAIRSPLPRFASCARVRPTLCGSVCKSWRPSIAAGAIQARAAIVRHLELMAADDPEWSGVLLWRALAAATAGEPFEAVKILREYVEREPDDHRGWNALVALQLPRADGLGDRPAPGVRAIEPDVMELVRTGHSAADLNMIGWYFALSHQAKTGLNFARRSIAARPSCGACWDTLALLLYRDGKPEQAVAIQKRAIAMMGDVAPGADALARLEAYRRARTSR